MDLKRLKYRIKAPCSRCPYRLGLVQTVVNPCPTCKENQYRTYEHMLRLRETGAEGERKEENKNTKGRIQNV